MVKIGHPSMSEKFKPPKFESLRHRDGVHSRSILDVIEEYFNGNWREGFEIHDVVITQRLYQTSPTSIQA